MFKYTIFKLVYSSSEGKSIYIGGNFLFQTLKELYKVFLQVHKRKFRIWLVRTCDKKIKPPLPPFCAFVLKHKPQITNFQSDILETIHYDTKQELIKDSRRAKQKWIRDIQPVLNSEKSISSKPKEIHSRS